MNLSIRQLVTFREVMRTGSVSEAARGLARTQPAVSATLAGLETELGFALFERERGRLVPTPEAQYFLEEADAVLDRLQQSARTMREIGGLARGRLRIACNPAASGFFMPRVVARFLHDRPGVRTSLMMRSSAVVTEWIASQQYDVGLAEAPPPRRAIAMEVFELACVCALPAVDPLAEEPYVTPRHLDGRPLAALFDEHVTHRALTERFAEAGAAFNQTFELQTFLPALQLVEAGLCACVCDALTAVTYELYKAERPRVVFRPFHPVIVLPMALMTPAHRPRSLLATAFVEFLSQELHALHEEFAPDAQLSIA